MSTKQLNNRNIVSFLERLSIKKPGQLLTGRIKKIPENGMNKHSAGLGLKTELLEFADGGLVARMAGKPQTVIAVFNQRVL